MKILEDIYDILAQNEDFATRDVKDGITELIDHLDNDRQVIVFRDKRGREIELQLVATYAPAPIRSK